MSPRMREDSDQEPSIYSLEGPRYSQSLERGLAILGCFTPQTPVLGIADIADTVEMSRSTTHRYVVTLLALGFLEQGAGRKYRLGLRVTDLGMSVLNATGLREHARPLLEELRQRLSYSVSLAVLDGTEIVYVDRARSYRRGQTSDVLNLQPGSRLPAYCTALGKILLAHLPEPEHKEILTEITLRKRGPNTIKNKKALNNELATVRDAGIALEDEENARELIAIAAPVYDQSEHVVAAVDISASASVIQVEEMTALGPHLLAIADRVSLRLGHRHG
jgi:IclR family pca regulon transcriptional regulator